MEKDRSKDRSERLESVPNATTVVAIEESQAGNLPRVESIEELFSELNAENE